MEQLKLLSNNGSLPLAYLEFMDFYGNGNNGDFMRGDSCFMDEIFYLKEGAVELLEDNQSNR
jgi:hypothetical protein